MSEVSRFFGIIIRMFANDHWPPHFHAVYGEFDASIEIETLNIYRGRLPHRALALVLEWASMHRIELRKNWEMSQQGQNPERIEPLL